MNLEWFLTRTATVDPCVLRRAMAAALPVEAPCNAECYARFCSLVVSEIEGGTVGTSALWRFA